MNNKGFSLIELIVILIIVGILSLFAFLTVSPYKGIKITAAAKKMTADLQYIRNLSLSTAKWYGISFEVDPVNVYTIYETDGTTDTIIENPAQLGVDFVVELNDYYSGMTINSVDIDGGNRLEFHPLGTPYTDRSASAITTAGSIILEFQGVTKEVTITPNTGKISIQ